MLRGLFAPREERAVTTADMWGPWYNNGYSAAGQSVNESTAMQLMAVYGCVRIISDSISTLPVDCFRKTADGREPVATPRWIEYPTADLTFTEWCGQILWSLLIHGNAYVWVMESSTSRELVVLDPCAVTAHRDHGRLGFFYKGARVDALVLHIKGQMMPGSDVGLSPIQAAQQSIGLGLAAQQFGAEFFQGEGNMPGVIEMPRPVQSAEKLKEMADQWRRRRRAGGRGLPGVLDDGATFKATGVTNEQAQFLATRQFTAAEIAGQMFLVDPSELGIPVPGTSLTYANLTDRKSRFVRTSLMPWIVRIEDALSTLLASPRYVKLNVDAFLRGDTAERYATYAVGLSNQFLTVPEVREFEDLPPADTPTTPAVAPVVASEPRSDGFTHTVPVNINLTVPPTEIRNDVHVPAAEVVNNVTVQPAVMPAPLVTVEAPRSPVSRSRTVQRDEQGRITGISES